MVYFIINNIFILAWIAFLCYLILSFYLLYYSSFFQKTDEELMDLFMKREFQLRIRYQQTSGTLFNPRSFVSQDRLILSNGDRVKVILNYDIMGYKIVRVPDGFVIREVEGVTINKALLRQKAKNELKKLGATFERQPKSYR